MEECQTRLDRLHKTLDTAASLARGYLGFFVLIAAVGCGGGGSAPTTSGTLFHSATMNVTVTPVSGKAVLQETSGQRAVASADFNGDGKVDLAVANNGNSSGEDGGVSILLRNGDGTFQATTNFPVG
jgi:FG-GAP repeat